LILGEGGVEGQVVLAEQSVVQTKKKWLQLFHEHVERNGFLQ
jgi:hypothetical protein